MGFFLSKESRMRNVEIYHNPQCSKSRKSLEILQSEYSDITITIREYKKDGLSLDEISLLSKLLHKNIHEFIRVKDELYKSIKTDWDNEEQAIVALHSNPSLLERPIIIFNERAVIGRPPENIFKLIEK